MGANATISLSVSGQSKYEGKLIHCLGCLKKETKKTWHTILHILGRQTILQTGIPIASEGLLGINSHCPYSELWGAMAVLATS